MVVKAGKDRSARLAQCIFPRHLFSAAEEVEEGHQSARLASQVLLHLLIQPTSGDGGGAQVLREQAHHDGVRSNHWPLCASARTGSAFEREGLVGRFEVLLRWLTWSFLGRQIAR